MKRLMLITSSLAVVLAGCGTPVAGPEVKGKVVLEDGKPLTTGTVIFHPEDTAQVTARGPLDDAGVFQLLPDGGGMKGIKTGKYKVSILGTKKNPKDEYALPVWVIPEKYGDPKTSGLTAEVVDNPGPDAFNFKVSSK